MAKAAAAPLVAAGRAWSFEADRRWGEGRGGGAVAGGGALCPGTEQPQAL